MKFREEEVTPAAGLKILEKNCVNRILTDSWVANLAQRMRKGDWLLSPDPICIGADGQVYNGQHRLWAVVYSGTTQRFFVCRDCPPEVMKVLDAGKPRGLRDIVNILQGMKGEEQLTTIQIASTRAFYELPTTHNAGWTSEKIIAAERRARPHLSFALEALEFKRRNLRIVNSSSIAAVARAHSHEVPEVTLAGFCKVFTTGEPSGVREPNVDSYVRKVRERLVTADQWFSGTGSFRTTLYFMLTKAVRLFDEGVGPGKVYQTTDDHYPLKKAFRATMEGVVVPNPSESFRKRQEGLKEA